MGHRQYAALKFAPALVVALTALWSASALAGSWLKPSPQDDTVLSAADAVQVQPALWRNGELTVGLDAAPGVYLYRDKLSVEAVDPGPAVGKLQLPAGDLHEDEHFGAVKVLRGRVIATASASAMPRQIRLRYQGCAENLVCYPPQIRILDVESLN